MGLIDNREAQFMLLAGFIIALGIVITTVLLNNIIFQGNMAGEAGSDPVKFDMVNLMQITAGEVKNAYLNSTQLTTNPQYAQNNFTVQMQNFNSNLSKIYALHGEAVNISWDISRWKNNLPANFTKNGMPGGAATNSNWTLIQNVNNATIVVNISTIPTPPFNINITNATKTWQINFTSPVNNFTVNNFQIQQNITFAYNISFVNGANVSGNYSITGNTTYGSNFFFDRDYILNATVTFSTSRVLANITIPISVPW